MSRLEILKTIWEQLAKIFSFPAFLLSIFQASVRIFKVFLLSKVKSDNVYLLETFECVTFDYISFHSILPV